MDRKKLLDSKHWCKFLEILFAICIMAGAMGDAKNLFSSLKVLSLGAIVLGVVVLLVTGDFRRLKKISRFFGVYGFILLGILVWSVFLWIMNLETISFIVRGAMKFGYQFFVLLIIASGVYMLGERAIYATFYGLAAANLLMVFMTVPEYGIAETLTAIMHFVTTMGDQQGFMRDMEIHDITFTFGFFIIYFIFFARRNKERVIDLIISIIFFIMGWKRIAVAALPVAIILCVAMGLMKTRTRVMIMNAICWCAVLFGFGYVLFVRYDVFNLVMQFFEVDTMGRNEVYDYIYQYYDISITFIGYGFEYTTVLLQDIIDNFPELKIGVLALHNNILTEYIELGFFGFWAWQMYTWTFQYRWMLNHQGEMVAMLFIACELYIYITYMTDNTLYYYWTSMVLRLMPMAYAVRIPEHTDQFYWPWIKIRKI
ncbi:MAG: hypothetical protein LIO59_04950 [Oscillospiraceae bacterium]|nr:hypothetical protein [Oscillospiraceae bacterium]